MSERQSTGLAPAPRHRDWNTGTGVAGYAWDTPNPKAIVLLQHGFAEYAQRFVSEHGGLVPRLLQAGISVRAIDFPGHGGSSGRSGMVDVGVAVRNHLRARRLLAQETIPLFLFGHSLGGMVTAASVCQDSAGIRGVILSGPALHVPRSRVLRWVTAALAMVAPSLRVAPHGNPDGLSRIAERVESARADPLMYKGPLRMVVAASALAVVHRASKRYEAWKTPTFVFHGSTDEYANVVGSIEFMNRIGSSDKTLHIEPEGRHELLNDTCSEDIMVRLIDWLGKRM